MSFYKIAFIIILSGVFVRTVYYRLDELYFGMLFLFYAVKYRETPAAAGMLLGFAILSRVCYLAFALAYLIYDYRPLKYLLLSTVAIAAVFISFAGFDAVKYNSFNTNFAAARFPPAYPLDYILLGVIPLLYVMKHKELVLSRMKLTLIQLKL